VHSAKDLPARLPEGLVIAAVPEREGPADVVCGAAALSELAAGAQVGTSSPRRAAQLRAARPDLEVVELRGNVDTRLRKLAEGECDAAVLARAGLARLGRLEAAGGELDWIPAPGQGALALEGRSGDTRVAGLNHPASRVAVEAERALVRELGATCHTPLGAHAELVRHGGAPAPSGGAPAAGASRALRLRAWLGLPDGSAWLADELEGDPIAPESLGREVGRRMRAAGAIELLEQAEAMAP
jgi:hydroxymethylbilane synthase